MAKHRWVGSDWSNSVDYHIEFINLGPVQRRTHNRNVIFAEKVEKCHFTVGGTDGANEIFGSRVFGKRYSTLPFEKSSEPHWPVHLLYSYYPFLFTYSTVLGGAVVPQSVCTCGSVVAGENQRSSSCVHSHPPQHCHWCTSRY